MIFEFSKYVSSFFSGISHTGNITFNLDWNGMPYIHNTRNLQALQWEFTNMFTQDLKTVLFILIKPYGCRLPLPRIPLPLKILCTNQAESGPVHMTLGHLSALGQVTDPVVNFALVHGLKPVTVHEFFIASGQL